MQNTTRRLLSCALLPLSLGCAGARRESEQPIGRSVDPPAALAPGETDPSAVQERGPAPPEDILAQHAAPIRGRRNVDARDFEYESLMTHLAEADVICFGERHDDPSDHFAELMMTHSLLERRTIRGFELGLGLEMVRTFNQPALDQFLAGQLDEDELVLQTNWDREWGFPIQYYRPQMREVLVQGGSLRALGVPREVTRKVAEKGLAGLDDNERRALPQLATDDTRHRSLFDAMMQEHPGAEGAALDRYYLAQVIWDESMAALASAWVEQVQPGRKLLIFAGAAHCHPSGIPSRIKKRGSASVVSVLPIAPNELPAQVPRPSAEPAEPPPASAPGSGTDVPAAPPGEAASAREMLVADYDYLLVVGG